MLLIDYEKPRKTERNRAFERENEGQRARVRESARGRENRLRVPREIFSSRSPTPFVRPYALPAITARELNSMELVLRGERTRGCVRR